MPDYHELYKASRKETLALVKENKKLQKDIDNLNIRLNMKNKNNCTRGGCKIRQK